MDGIMIKIKLDGNDWDYAYNRAYLRHPHVIESNDGTDWIQKCVYGQILPNELEDMRVKEINSLDMLSNTQMLNHSEVIIEM